MGVDRGHVEPQPEINCNDVGRLHDRVSVY